MAQRYLSSKSWEWMAQGLCPECGYLPDSHALSPWENLFGMGLSNCSLRADGVRDRIAQYDMDERLKKAEISAPPELLS